MGQIDVKRDDRQRKTSFHCIILMDDALGSPSHHTYFYNTRNKVLLMNTYPESKYPGLYEEIIKDHNFRFGKFSPIPCPNMNDKTQPIVVDWSERGGKNGND